MDPEIDQLIKKQTGWENFKIKFIQHQIDQEDTKSENLPPIDDQVRDYSLGKSLKPNEDSIKAEMSTTKKIAQRSLEVNKKLVSMDDVKKL